MLASLSHPNIAALYGLEESGGKRFIVMELVEGQTLAKRLLKGTLPADEPLNTQKAWHCTHHEASGREDYPLAGCYRIQTSFTGGRTVGEKRNINWSGFIALTSLLAVTSAQARDLNSVFGHLLSVKPIEEGVISPDGTSVAWVSGGIRITPLDSTASGLSSWSAGAIGSNQAHGVAWSHDGSQIAFLDDAEQSGQSQLYATMKTEKPRRLTNLTGALASPAWSPSKKLIAFLFIENAPRMAGPMAASAPQTGVIGEKGFRQRLAVVDVSTGQVRQLTPPNLYVYDFDWSPASDRLAITAAFGSGDDNWYLAQLWTVDVSNGFTRSILKPQFQIEWPVWSPDGRSIAFIGGLMSDEDIGAGDVYAMDASGGPARNLTPDMKASATWPRWVAPDRLLFSAHQDGGSAIFSLDPSSKRLERIWHGDEFIGRSSRLMGFTVDARGSHVATIRESYTQPPEVWAGAIGRWSQLTNLNSSAQVEWGRAESVHWKNEGFDVQGWLIYPRQYDPSKRYPMIVEVHGGPGYAHIPGWPDTWYCMIPLSASGYFVFLPNPRGSYGTGESYTRANVKDFGYGDLRDILTGVEEVIRMRPIDPSRLGITGWSYGGYMTMWAVTQTPRFKAAVAGAGIANWQSYYGQNMIDQWLIPFFGASVYDDPAIYARSAPITFIKQAKTPTLIVVGERDAECPAPQSFEFWHALKTLGVETSLVVYANEGHGIMDPKNRRDILLRAAAWFDEHLR